jgi:hypothetical protein
MIKLSAIDFVNHKSFQSIPVSRIDFAEAVSKYLLLWGTTGVGPTGSTLRGVCIDR